MKYKLLIIFLYFGYTLILPKKQSLLGTHVERKKAMASCFFIESNLEGKNSFAPG
jgi:hypothetical protein